MYYSQLYDIMKNIISNFDKKYEDVGYHFYDSLARMLGYSIAEMKALILSKYIE